MIYVVLVNFKGVKDTIACLESLNENLVDATRIVVVENGSGDGSLEMLDKWLASNSDPAKSKLSKSWCRLNRADRAASVGIHQVTVISSSENLGFAGGCNLGMNLALKDFSCSHVWLLNNDTIIRSDALSPLLLRFQGEPRMGMCGSTLIYHGAPDTVQACGGRFNPATGRGKPLCGGSKLPVALDQRFAEAAMDYVVGASLLVSREMIDHVGLMDDRYFLYFEEIDWAYRAQILGYTLGWAPDSVVYHKEGGSIGTSTRERPSNLAIYFMTVSYLRFANKHRPWLVPLGLLISAARAFKWALTSDFVASRKVALAIRNFIRSPERCVRDEELPMALGQ